MTSVARADQLRLNKMANKLKQDLKKSFGNVLRITNTKVQPTNTNGWLIKLAKLRGNPIRLELWLDQFSNAPLRCFYGGFCSNSEKLIQNIADDSPFNKRRIRTITSSDLLKKEGTYFLKKHLSKKDASLPALDVYSLQNIYYFGLYDLQSERCFASISKRIYDFFAEALNSQFINRIGQNIDEDFFAYEGKAKRGRRQSRTRNAKLAADFISRKDNFACEAKGCDFDATKIIGKKRIDPRTLLDVHHKYPLHEGERKSTINDFVLLCPNCHRLEHAKLRAGAKPSFTCR